MPKRLHLTDDDIEWLADHYGAIPLGQMAARYSVCIDTMKRVLMRHDIAFFDGAKYATSATSQVPTWQRPCLDCACTKTRPKGWYYCRKCRLKRGFDPEEHE